MTNTYPEDPELSFFTRELPVALTSDEHHMRARELARRLRERTDIEADRKTTAATFKARLDAADQSINELAIIVADGAEVRPVECAEAKDYTKGVVNSVRLDTHTVIDVRPMTDSERQTVLPLAGKEH